MNGRGFEYPWGQNRPIDQTHSLEARIVALENKLSAQENRLKALENRP